MVSPPRLAGLAAAANAHQRRALPVCGAAVVDYVATIEEKQAAALNVNDIVGADAGIICGVLTLDGTGLGLAAVRDGNVASRNGQRRLALLGATVEGVAVQVERDAGRGDCDVLIRIGQQLHRRRFRCFINSCLQRGVSNPLDLGDTRTRRLLGLSPRHLSPLLRIIASLSSRSLLGSHLSVDGALAGAVISRASAGYVLGVTPPASFSLTWDCSAVASLTPAASAKAAVGIIDTTIVAETSTVSALRPNADLRIPITFLSVAIDVQHQAPDVGTAPTFQAVMQANPCCLHSGSGDA